MASLGKMQDDPAAHLWSEIDGVHAGMLGLQGSHLHFQPMAPHADPHTNAIWFYSRSDTALVEALHPSARAHFCLIGRNHDYHACLTGTLEIRNDPAKRDEYWSTITEAWYDGGKDDPRLVMLALKLDEADIWASTGNPLKFGWEIARANLNDNVKPAPGVHRHLRFA